MAGPTIIYVCDTGRLHHLLMSVCSWRRYASFPMIVVDIGLTERARASIRSVLAESVTFHAPLNTGTAPPSAEQQRIFAYLQKTALGKIRAGDPIIFLDSDILVVDGDFFPRLLAVKPGELLASPSAWDADFLWTYTDRALPALQRVSNFPSLQMASPVCNSGVWAMRSNDAADVAAQWLRAYRAAIASPDLVAATRPGRLIGDQEFLIPACHAAGVTWTPLHGSFNMQVHESKMRWELSAGAHPFGGHKSEHSERVRAIHFGCERDGRVSIDEDMLPTDEVRAWVHAHYRECWALVRAHAHAADAPA